MSFYFLSGFTASNSTSNYSLTSTLASNTNYDYLSTNDTNERYIYRVQQSNALVGSLTVPQLVLSIWSGMLPRLINVNNRA
jgi:hypothetical protein